MALDPVVNFFRSTIATLPVASGGTSIVITTGDGAKLPDPAVDGAFNLTIYNEDDPFDAPEIVRVTAIAGDTLTVTRAQEGTSATNKTAGNTWYLELTPTAKTIQDIDTAKLDVADVVNNLTSTDTDKALSANQGKVLQDGKEPADATILKQANIVDNLTSTSTTAPLSANQGKVLQDGKLNLSGGTMTGDLTIPDKIIHSGDTDTAIRFPSADTVTVETGGVEALRCTSGNDVAIGRTSANGKLDVNGKLYIESNQDVQSSVGFPNTIRVFNSAEGRMLFNTHFATSTLGGYAFNTASSTKLFVRGDGNVGIGTTAPATALEVNSTTNPVIRISNGGGISPSPSLVLYRQSGVSGTISYEPSAKNLIIQNDYTTVDAGGNIYFNTRGASTKMSILGNGNVGIGTTSPSSKLHVDGGAIGSSAVAFFEGDTYGLIGVSRGTQTNASAGINYFTGATQKWFTGVFENTDNFGFFNSMPGVSGFSMVITNGNNVGIGTTSPANPLTVNGIVSPSTDNARTLGTASLRWSEVFAGNATINTSDATEKQDIAELNEAEQQVATALKGLIRKYRWISSVEQKGEDARIHVGVMAQDVAQAFEDAGLDAHRYGVFCEDTWYTKEETYTEQVENPDFDEEAEEGEDNLRMIDGEEQTRTVPCEADDLDATEHVRFGVRYDQLWAFIISAL